MRLIKYLLFILILFVSSNLKSQGHERISQLENIVKNNPESLISFIESKQDETLTEAQEIYLLSFANEKLGNYIKADSLIQFAFKNFSFKNDSDLYIKYYKVLIDQKKILADFESALEMLNKVNEYSERKQDTVEIITTHILMGEFYRAVGDIKMSLEFLYKAERLISYYSQKIPGSIEASLLNRKAATFFQSSVHLDSVKLFSLMAIHIGKNLNDKDIEAVSSNELGFLYCNENPANPKSEFYLLNAINLWEEMGYSVYSTNARLNLSRYYLKIKMYDEAIQNLVDIYEVINESKRNSVKGEYYDLLSILYGLINDYKQAYKYSLKSKSLLLEVNANYYHQRTKLLSIKLEMQKKEVELGEKSMEIRRFRLESDEKRKENTLLYAILISFSVIGVILTLFWLNSNKQRNKLRKQQTQIIEINDELTDVIGEKESLLQEVNHRVKNNLSILSSLLYLQQKKIENPEVKSAIKDSLLRINTISLVHESLYQRNDMSHVDFQEYLNKLINYNKSIYWGNRPLELIINCDGLAPDLSTSVPLAMIINEMVTNSFKYAFDEVGNPQIRVIFLDGSLMYSDNGPGKEDNGGKESLGLKLISIFSKQIHATISSYNDEFGFHHIIKLENY